MTQIIGVTRMMLRCRVEKRGTLISLVEVAAAQVPAGPPTAGPDSDSVAAAGTSE